jgi:hypothetical protein
VYAGSVYSVGDELALPPSDWRELEWVWFLPSD